MFWKRKPANEEPSQATEEKLPKPHDIAELVGRYIIVELKQDPDWVWRLTNVLRPRPGSKSVFDFRVYDSAEVIAKKVNVRNWHSLDDHPELVLYEGWFDKSAYTAEVTKKRK